MTQLALKIQGPCLQLVEGGKYKQAPREVFLLTIVLIVLQILDGVLTSIGVNHFGHQAEGNYLIRMLMELIGATPALIVVKTLAILVILHLCTLAKQVRWLRNALRGVAFVYIVAAIIPWSAIILTRIV